MDSQMARLIGERRKRLVASILGHAEREFWDGLSTDQQQDFRRKVLNSVDDFADLMRDVLKIASGDAMVNQHALELLESVHDSQKSLLEKLG